MDEYNLEVIIDGHKEKIKTYANSIDHAIDSIVALDNVESIFIATRTRDNKKWDLHNIKLNYLRELRGKIENESDIQSSLAVRGLHDE